ncbi:MAG TPA: ATP synthase F1 subunit gamma, partial [Anaerolineales bacterium]|nr:ATP synthase F1 subunit gamma [Anaerolineales bacterium]
AKVRKAVQAVAATRPYATKAWQVLTHVAAQPGRHSLHPLLTERLNPKAALVIVITGDRGLAGAYNTNIIRFIAQQFDASRIPVKYIAVGRKGRDLLIRRRKDLLADFSNLPAAPSFADVSAIGRLAVTEFESGRIDQVFLVYTDFVNMARQVATMKKLLPLELASGGQVMELQKGSATAAYEYEPDLRELLDEIIPRFTGLQVYQAILESQASEHAARMVAMHSATDNARELAAAYELQYNKMRQSTITSDILDIVGGAEAQAAA